MSPRVLRHHTEAANPFGARIVTDWPLNGTFYPASLIEYDARTRRYKVLYDRDNSIEEVCLTPHGEEEYKFRRLWKRLVSAEAALASMEIHLPILTAAGGEATEFPACVLGVDEAEFGKKRTPYRVLLLENDVIAVVNLSEVWYAELE